MGQTSPEGGPSRRVVEVAAAVIVAIVVASGVVAVGMVTRDDQQNTADPDTSDVQSEEPDEGDPQTGAPEETTGSEDEDESTDEPSDEDSDEPKDGPTGGLEPPEVTEVDVAVDKPDYTGRCPVTLEYSVGITTINGPVQVEYSWLDKDSNPVASEDIRLDGPHEQSVRPEHPVEVTPSAAESETVQRTVEITAPHGATSNTVVATVTCTPYAEITKAGEEEDPPLAAGCHLLHFDATITAPRDMTVTYEWQRLDGSTARTGVQTAEFSGGGVQTQSIPRQSLALDDVTGEFGYRLHIIEPYDVLSNPVTYEVRGCSEPAT